MAAGLAVRVAASRQFYHLGPLIEATRSSLIEMVRRRAALDRCNAFEFVNVGHQADPADRMGQFFFGRRVVERLRRGDPIRPCQVDLAGRTVHSIE